MNTYGGKYYQQDNNSGEFYNAETIKIYHFGNAQEPIFEVLGEKYFEKAARSKTKSKIINLKTADWLLILQKGYIERDQQSTLLEVTQELAKISDTSWLLIRGEHGAGKTALLLWLTHELFRQGHRIVYKSRRCDLNLYWFQELDKFSEEIEGQHFYVIIDDLFRQENLLDGLHKVEFPFPCTIIGTTRLNEDQQDRLGSPHVKCLDLNRNSEAEKQLIINKVCEDEDVKAKFQGMTSEKRQELMDSPNMLVLMLQLSEGKVFNSIIADSIRKLSATGKTPVYEVFGVVCSFFQYGVFVPIEILKLCLPKGTFLKKQTLKKLEGLVETTSASGAYKTENLTTIHELIAKTAMQVEYYPSDEENYPYSSFDNPSLFEKNLRLVIENLDVTQEIQRSWIRNSLRVFASRVSCDINLIRKILIEYKDKLYALQKGSSVTAWTSWGKIYFEVGLLDEYSYCIKQAVNTKPQNFIESNYWLGHVKKLNNNNLEELKNLANKVENLLRNEPENQNIRYVYLGLIGHSINYENVKNIFGNLQNIIIETEQWLKNNPQYYEIYSMYLVLVNYHCNHSERLKAVVKTTKWLKKHSESHQPFNQKKVYMEQKVSSTKGSNARKRRSIRRAKEKAYKRKQANKLLIDSIDTNFAYNQYSTLIQRYFKLIKSCNISKHQFSAIFQTGSWIDVYLNKTNDRISYIELIDKYGTPQQIEEVIAEIENWLELHKNDCSVRTRYLGLIDKYGTPQQIEEVIAEIENWLELHKSLFNIFFYSSTS